MSAAFAVAAGVAVVAILALVLTARQAAAKIAAERARVDERDVQLSEAEHAQALAVARADLADQRAADGEVRLGATGTLWDLERFRLEREWAEVTGSPAPLPEPWDGSVRAAVAAELELIREVMGVPSRLESSGAPTDVPAVAEFRLIAEVLRGLARVGDEIGVAFGPTGVVTVTVATRADGPGPELTRLTSAAAALGGELTLVPVAGGFQARLRLPAGA